jgi:hypothetical protein
MWHFHLHGGTLYELTRLTDEQFQAGLDTGVIHSGMKRKDVAKLKPRKEKPPAEPEDPVPPAKRKLRKSALPPHYIVMGEVQSLISDVLDDLDDEKRRGLFDRLRAMIDTFERRRRLFNILTGEFTWADDTGDTGDTVSKSLRASVPV